MTASPDNYTWTHVTDVFLGEFYSPDAVRLFAPLASLAKDGPYKASDLMHDAASIIEWVLDFDGNEQFHPMRIRRCGCTATLRETAYWSTREGGGTWFGDFNHASVGGDIEHHETYRLRMENRGRDYSPRWHCIIDKCEGQRDVEGDDR